MINSKKAIQLGMNPSTASGRLVKDTLFNLAIATGHKCFQCGGELSRETFSIEHKVPWLDSNDPLGLYFDQDNIAFSHLICNIKESRGGEVTIYKNKQSRVAANNSSKKRYRDKIDHESGLTNRQLQYKRTGK